MDRTRRRPSLLSCSLGCPHSLDGLDQVQQPCESYDRTRLAVGRSLVFMGSVAGSLNGPSHGPHASADSPVTMSACPRPWPDSISLPSPVCCSPACLSSSDPSRFI